MKIIGLLLMCALFAGCSSVSHTNSPTGAADSASQARPQYHAHVVTDYSSEGGTKFLEMDTNDDAAMP